MIAFKTNCFENELPWEHLTEENSNNIILKNVLALVTGNLNDFWIIYLFHKV